MSNQTQDLWLLLLIGAWLALGVFGAIAQWQRGGNWGQGLVITLALGPLGLLIANYSGGRQCPFCKSRGLDRRATKCPKCGSVLT